MRLHPNRLSVFMRFSQAFALFTNLPRLLSQWPKYEDILYNVGDDTEKVVIKTVRGSWWWGQGRLHKRTNLCPFGR